jgi:hypothetical protein
MLYWLRLSEDHVLLKKEEILRKSIFSCNFKKEEINVKSQENKIFSSVLESKIGLDA